MKLLLSKKHITGKNLFFLKIPYDFLHKIKKSKKSYGVVRLLHTITFIFLKISL